MNAIQIIIIVKCGCKLNMNAIDILVVILFDIFGGHMVMFIN